MTTYLHPAFLQGKVYLAPLALAAVAVPVVTGVTIVPATISMNGGLEQFVATSQGTNVANDTYTWTTTIGAIGSDGLLSVTATEVDQVGTVTATSVLNGNFSATANVTVLSTLGPSAPEIPSVMPGTLVSMHFISPNGNPIAHTQVEIQLKQADFRDSLNAVYMPRLVMATTDFDGRCLVKLMACKTPYYVTVFDPISDAALSYKFLVPESLGPDSVIHLQDILIDTELSLGFDEQALAIIAEAKADAVTAAEQAEADAKEIRELFASLTGPDGASKVGYKTGTVADALNTGGNGGGTGTGNSPEIDLDIDANGLVTADALVGNRFRVLLTKDAKIANPVNFDSDQSIFFTFYQDLVGGHKLNYGLQLLLAGSQPYAPPGDSGACFMLELRPTVNPVTNELNWAVMSYPDKSFTGGFGLVTQIAYIGNTGYYTMGAALGSIADGQTVRVTRNGFSSEATGSIPDTIADDNNKVFRLYGAPVPGNGTDQRPILALGTYDFGEGPPRGPNRPSFGKALLNFEGKGTTYIRDLRVRGARNDDSDARGICNNQAHMSIVVNNVEVTDCNNGVMSGNDDMMGTITLIDVNIDRCGVGGPDAHNSHGTHTSDGYTHGTYFGHNDSSVSLLRCSVTNSVAGNDLKCRTGTLILKQVLCTGAVVGRELEFPNGGVLDAQDSIFYKQDFGSGQNNLCIIGGNSGADNAVEGTDTSRPRSYKFTNCTFQNDKTLEGKDVTFIICMDREVPVEFIDCEFIGPANDAHIGSGDYPGMTTVNGIRYWDSAPPIFTNTGGPIGPRTEQVGYKPVAMTQVL